METIKINIINPKARKLLQNLDELNLISIKESTENNFSQVLNKIRSKSDSPLNSKEIAQEVDVVRSKRYD